MTVGPFGFSINLVLCHDFPVLKHRRGDSAWTLLDLSKPRFAPGVGDKLATPSSFEIVIIASRSTHTGDVAATVNLGKVGAVSPR